jgi:hypothetical protein
LNVEDRVHSILCKVATFSIRFFPMIVAISIKASISSLDWNSGNLPVRKNNKIIPTDQTSIAAYDSHDFVGEKM